LTIEDLKKFFSPQSVAVIGASERSNSIGTRIFRNLRESYKGSTYAVNAFRQTIDGCTAYPSIDRVPTKVDLAIIATPAHIVPQVAEECGRAGVTNIVIVSAGFESKNKTDNFALQLKEVKQKYNLKILGPNSFGVIRPHVGLYATFAEKKGMPGKVAFISQSGALCGSALDWSSETQVGLSAVVSVGFGIDVDFADLIDYFGNDSQTRLIMLYVESIPDIRRFMSAARGYARTKPIVLIKANRIDSSQTTTSEQLNLQNALYDAAFSRSGIVKVNTINDLFDCAKTLLMRSSPTSPCLTIVTNASGPALLASEQLKRLGGQLVKPSQSTICASKEVLPNYCSFENPIDLLEEATPERYRDIIQSCLGDEATGSLFVIYAPVGLTEPQAFAKTVVETAKRTTKNILVCLMGESPECQIARGILQQNNIPAFRFPEQAVRTFMHIYVHNQNLQMLYQTPEELNLKRTYGQHLDSISRQAYFEGRSVLNFNEVLEFLKTYEIPVIKTLRAETAEDCLKAVSEIGFPMILKIDEATADIYSEVEIQESFDQLLEKTMRSQNPINTNAVLQPKICEFNNKIFMRSRKDPQCGPVVFLEVGGNISKTGEHLSAGFPPLNQVLAKQMFSNLTVYNELESESKSNLAKAEEIIVKFSQLAVDFPQISEANIELLMLQNQVLVTNAQVTIDRHRIMREGAEFPEHFAIAPYPKKYITRRTLKDQTKVTLRPIKPEDENRFNELFKSLSTESVRFRFFEIIKELSHDTLSRYCNLDYDREMAIVAQFETDCRFVGVVRLILDKEPKGGEFAIMVGDAWQGLGLGSKLMDLIIDVARDFRLERIYSLVNRENYKMINLCRKKGFDIQPIDDYSVDVSIKITPLNI
jgi:acetyltransferase